MVSVILDGENAWEYYPYNAYYFLRRPVRRAGEASADPHRHLRDVLGDAGAAARSRCPQLVAGSWVYGNLSTWIGSPDKNRAWDLLARPSRATIW